MLLFLQNCLPAVIVLLLAGFATAAPTPPDAADGCEAVQDVTLQEFRWKYRIIVLSAPAASDETYRQQLEQLYAEDAGLIERDLRILSLLEAGCSTLDGHPVSDESAARIKRQLGVDTDSFSVRLIGKDGGVKVHERVVLPPDWLFAVIDGMPMRQREMREQK